MKQICRYYQIKGFSKKKKPELVNLILTSLTDEQLKEIANKREKEWVTKGINKALDIIYSNPSGDFKSFYIVDEIACKVKMDYEWYNELSSAFICITNKNIDDPEFECDCSLGPESGFCEHFWLGFIFSQKCGYFDLDNWKMIDLSDDYIEKIKNVEIIKNKSGDILLIDKYASNSILSRNSKNIFKGEKVEYQICQTCGNKCSPRAFICPRCNQKLHNFKNSIPAQICESCGNICSPRAFICPKCNQNLKKLKHDTTVKICQTCGNKCSPRALICPNCNQNFRNN